MSQPASLRRWFLRALIGGLTAVSIIVLACPAIPLGVPGEWVWSRWDLIALDPVALVGGVLCCAGYWWGATWGEGRLRRNRLAGGSSSRSPDDAVWNEQARPLTRTHLSGLCLLAFVWLTSLLLIQPDYQGLARSPTVLYYKRTEGYFWQAAFEVNDSREFLRHYQDAISRGDDPDRYLHIGTHPPGLTLCYRGLLECFQTWPGVTDALMAIEPPSIREAFDALRDHPTPHGQLTRPEEATLWAATLLTLAAAAGACWPIYRLATRFGGPLVGWRAAVLWPLVPSLLVFFPKSDVLCPVIATASGWLWLDGWSRQRWGRCVLAGVGVFFGLMLTLALAPIALLLVIQTIVERWMRREEFRERRLMADGGAVAAAVLGLLLPLTALSLWGQCHIVAIWFQNLRNHGLFYEHNSRSFGTWLVINPMEAAFALGLPMAVFVGVGSIRLIRSRTTSPLGFAQMVAWLSVWSILWLSGKNMGEAARLWIFLAPWPVMTAAWVTVPSPRESSHGENRSPWRVVLALQLVVMWWTMVRLDGFHFAELISAS